MPVNYPWGAFNSFIKAVDKFSEDKPTVFTADKLGLQEAYASQIISCFRFFDFANSNNVPTELFDEFVSSQEKPNFIKEILKQKYSEIFSQVNEDSEITEDLLEEFFKNTANSIYTARKRKAFFINATKYAGISIAAKARQRKMNRDDKNSPKTQETVDIFALQTDDKNNIQNDTNDSSQGTSRTIILKSGGKLTLTVSVNIFELEKGDRDFVFSLIDKLKDYEHE